MNTHNQSIQVQIKQVYGNELIYPVCDTAKVFALLANQKTLTMKEISLIKTLGYSIQVVANKTSL